jgi:hypothetical protein
MRYGDKRSAYKILVAKPEGNRPLGRPRHRLEANIENESTNRMGGGMHWTNLTQDGKRW